MYKNYTLSDIAQKANVSIPTVSRVVNNTGSVKRSTKERVITAIKELDKPKNRVILAAVPNFMNPFCAMISRGISNAAMANGYKVVHYQFESFFSPDDYKFFVENSFFDGLIIGTPLSNTSLLKEIADRIPVVMCSEINDIPSITSVSINDYESAYNAMKYLISTGRKKIAMLNSNLRNNYASERERAFRDCLKDHGLRINESWISHLPAIDYDLGYTSAASILEQDEKPDAAFCVSDIFAVAFMNAAKNAGLSIPKDVAVIGFDNIDIAKMIRPALTTVSQPAYQIGVQACNLLIEELEFPSIAPNHVLLETELILRDST